MKMTLSAAAQKRILFHFMGDPFNIRPKSNQVRLAGAALLSTFNYELSTAFPY
jgi:hypothetical protein